MSTPFFSVVIPTLNEEQFIPLILNDLQKQNDKDFEVIVVDASSTDKTKDVIRERFNKLPVKLYMTDKRNVSFQRNFGALKAQGFYLLFLDADTRIRPSFIKLSKKIISKKKGLVFIPRILPDEKGAQVDMLFQFINFLLELSISVGKPFSSGGNMVIERSFFHMLGGFDEKIFMSEDHHLIQQAYNWGVRPKMAAQLSVTYSLRRLKAEGRLRFMYKYLIAITHTLFRGAVRKKLFEYEMGGQLYSTSYFRRKIKENSLLSFISQIKQAFVSILKEE